MDCAVNLVGLRVRCYRNLKNGLFSVQHKGRVIAYVAAFGDMTWSDAQGFVDFGSFDYMQCLAKGLTPAETAKVLLKDTAPVEVSAAALDEIRDSQAQLRELAKHGNEFHKHFLAESIKEFGDLTEVHQIGQPITHAPTIAALAEVVTLARAQMEREAQTSPTVAQEDTTALLVEHQGDEYTRTCNDEEPDELIRARHGEPAPVLTPKPMSKRKFLFSTLRLAGHRVVTLHQVGKCAVARVFPCEGRAPFYAARFRQHTAEFGHLHEAEQALLTLRRLDNAEIRRDNEVLTATDALDQLDLSPACFARFCTLHELDVGRSYTRRELRRAITDRRQPKMPVYLSLLNKLTVTNPATK